MMEQKAQNRSQRPLTAVLRTSNDGIENLEQITEVINSGTENIKGWNRKLRTDNRGH